MRPNSARPEPRPESWLVQELTSARVLDTVQLRPYLHEFRGTTSTGDATALAASLVRAGLLTSFQADRAVAGEAGKLVLGPYLLTDSHASGSLGAVYRAVGRLDHKPYAIRVLPLRSLWNVHLAKEQVRAFAGLPDHPAVVPLADIDSAGGFHYLAWPFVEGTTLDAVGAAFGRLPVSEAVRVAGQLADGLAVCHAQGIAHGLLKPSNVLLGADDQPRLLELGIGAILSENLADGQSMLDTLSTATAAIGMFDCCAPEWLDNPTVRTPAGDLYSFGCVLHFLLTGSLPFPDGTAVCKALAHKTRPPPSAAGLNPGVPAWLEDLVLALLRKDPAARPAEAVAVATLLGAREAPSTIQSVPASGTPTGVPGPARPPRPTGSADFIDFDLPDEPTLESEFDFTATSTPPRTMSLTDTLALGRRPAAAVTPGPVVPAIPEPMTHPRVSLSAEIVLPLQSVAADSQRWVPLGSDATGTLLGRVKRALLFWRPPSDVVQLSVFGPPQSAPGAKIQVHVYAHEPAAVASVSVLSRAYLPDGVLLATDCLWREVLRGAEIGLLLEVENAEVGRPRRAVRWPDRPQPRMFEIHVPRDCPAGPTAGVLSAGLGAALAGRVEFRVRILQRRA
jgi:serine/threonine-protein kinase